MKNKLLLPLLFIFFCFFNFNYITAQNNETKNEETIFVFGGDINLKFVQYVTDLTNKQNPKICYLPTAAADHQDNIKFWESICKRIGIDTLILKVWVSSSPTNRSFEEILLNADAIVVGGGNTLNMLGIWKYQGIDSVLYKALKKGIILAGGSAGSICWFQNGISDSRPVNLSLVDGFGYLPYSNCPHYSEKNRKQLYHQMITDKKISSGYACDELAGILFKNGAAFEFVSQSDNHNSYFVEVKNGTLQTKKMESKILLKKDALLENDYTTLSVKKKINEVLEADNNITPLNAYIATTKKLRLSKDSLSQSERDKVLNISIEKIFVNDKLAGVVNNAYKNYYGLYYFYNCNGTWEPLGEDVGGETLFESEITFREKAKIMIERAQKQLNCR
ncbi:MAG: peptidase E [bacterium]